MDMTEYLKRIPSEEESIKKEASIYKKMKFAERLRCFQQIMELVERFCPTLKYKDGEESVEKLWRFSHLENEKRQRFTTSER